MPNGAVLGRGPKRDRLLKDTLIEYYRWMSKTEPQPQLFTLPTVRAHASEEDSQASEGPSPDGPVKGRKDTRLSP